MHSKQTEKKPERERQQPKPVVDAYPPVPRIREFPCGEICLPLHDDFGGTVERPRKK
jgi:hypothetical protein